LVEVTGRYFLICGDASSYLDQVTLSLTYLDKSLLSVPVHYYVNATNAGISDDSTRRYKYSCNWAGLQNANRRKLAGLERSIRILDFSFDS
jgi:hypothetical protein